MKHFKFFTTSLTKLNKSDTILEGKLKLTRIIYFKTDKML